MAYKKRKTTTRKRIQSSKSGGKGRRRSVSQKTTAGAKKFSDKQIARYIQAVLASRGEEE